MKANDRNPTTGALSFDLSSRELSALIKQAKSGDGSASLRIYRYYDFVKLDRVSSIKWLKHSAENENAQAQYILGKNFLDDLDQSQRNEGIYWLKRSSANGYIEAKSELERH